MNLTPAPIRCGHAADRRSMRLTLSSIAGRLIAFGRETIVRLSGSQYYIDLANGLVCRKNYRFFFRTAADLYSSELTRAAQAAGMKELRPRWIYVGGRSNAFRATTGDPEKTVVYEKLKSLGKEAVDGPPKDLPWFEAAFEDLRSTGSDEHAPDSRP